MFDQEIIRAMLESEVQPQFGFLGMTVAGLTAAAPYIATGVGSLFDFLGMRQGSSQAAKGLKVSHLEWLLMKREADRQRAEAIERQEKFEAQRQEERSAHLRLGAPYRAASRAMLGWTNQTDVLDPEEEASAYGNYIHRGPRV